MATALQELDESRPAKRVRVGAALDEDVSAEVEDNEDDWNDIYENDAGADKPVSAVVPSQEDPSGEASISVEAGDLADGVTSKMALDGNHDRVESQESTKAQTDGGVPSEAIDTGDDLVMEAEIHPTSTDTPSTRVLEETTQVEAPPGHSEEEVSTKAVDSLESSAINGDPASSSTKAAQDPEFLAAAAAQKSNTEAEWQFNSSDAESSSDDDSDSDSSSDDSDSDDEGGYEMLDPATVAKILMAGDGEDEDGDKNKSKGDHQPRTQNEMKHEVVPKPDVVVTEDMNITFLGTVEYSVENMILVKAVTPGEYQVLEAGSVLCREDREVVGAVSETLGRVQQPMYSIAFTNEQEAKDSGLEVGSRVYYVDKHSTFVFTQPLRHAKGTDASNIHDEEIGEDEAEFSDDEKEAEYKRMKKLAKRGGRGGLSRSAFNAGAMSHGAAGFDESSRSFINNSDAPQQQYGGGMSYDDNDAQDEFYSPLKRPDNLSQLMATGGQQRPVATLDRGRGRGRGDHRGRGRGDRGRGRGGFDHNSQRGGRGAHGGNRANFPQSTGHRGNARSFPDRHNHDVVVEQRTHPLPFKPAGPSSPPSHQQNAPTHQYQQPQAQAPQSYQFNGYTFQYGHGAVPPNQSSPQPPYSATTYPQQPAPPQIPPGAYVNPAFFQGSSQPQQPPPSWPQNQWNAQQVPHATQYPPQFPQQQQQPPPPGGPAPQSNLADILRNIGGQQR